MAETISNHLDTTGTSATTDQSSVHKTLARLLAQADVMVGGTRPFDVQFHDPKVPDRVFAMGSLGLGEPFYRMWRYYLLSCASAFRARDMQLWQWVFSKEGVQCVYKRPNSTATWQENQAGLRDSREPKPTSRSAFIPERSRA